VSELERDLGTTTSDLATTNRQFSQVTNQLQVATEEAARLRDANAIMSQILMVSWAVSSSPCLAFRSLLVGP
jgi:hypothetical protein